MTHHQNKTYYNRAEYSRETLCTCSWININFEGDLITTILFTLIIYLLSHRWHSQLRMYTEAKELVFIYHFCGILNQNNTYIFNNTQSTRTLRIIISDLILAFNEYSMVTVQFLKMQVFI
jgi:hypothetical protein